MSSTGVKSTVEDNLSQLIKRARLGDKQAAIDLVNHPKIIKMSQVIGVRLARDNRDYDYKNNQDFQQEILLKLWQKITTFEGGCEKKFWGWLWRIAKNNLEDNRRKTNKEMRVIEKNGLENIDFGLREDLYDRVCIDNWLESLDEVERLIVELHVEGWSLEEIGNKLPEVKSKSTVHRYLNGAQKKLTQMTGWKRVEKKTKEDEGNK